MARLAAFLAAGAMLAGCGGTGTPTRASFIARADAACRQNPISDPDVRSLDATSVAQVADVLSRAQVRLRRVQDALGRIAPPDKEARALLRMLDREGDLFQGILGYMQGGADNPNLPHVIGQFDTLAGRLLLRARAYGLRTCFGARGFTPDGVRSTQRWVAAVSPLCADYFAKDGRTAERHGLRARNASLADYDGYVRAGEPVLRHYVIAVSAVPKPSARVVAAMATAYVATLRRLLTAQRRFDALHSAGRGAAARRLLAREINPAVQAQVQLAAVLDLRCLPRRRRG